MPANISVDKTSGWRHHYFDVLSEIPSFIKLIGDGKIYLIIPFMATSKSLSKPRLRLSQPFLVNNKSNSILIAKLVLNQWESSGFNVNEASSVYIGFEFKEVWFSYK
jgi:hypothetical protein